MSALPRSLPSILGPGECRSHRRLAGNRHLGPDLGTLDGVIAAFNRAVVDDRVLFFRLRRETSRSAKFAPKPHVSLVIRAMRHCRLADASAQDNIQQTRHSWFSQLVLRPIAHAW